MYFTKVPQVMWVKYKAAVLGITIMKIIEIKKIMVSIQFHKDLLKVHYEFY